MAGRPDATPTSGSRPKLLVVDDYADFRNLVRFTVGGDCEVLEAADAGTGLQLARRERPAVVLIDVMMPGPLDGIWLLSAIRNDRALQRMRIALVSGVLGTGSAAEAVVHQADAVFAKPFSPLQLRQWIRGLLAEPAAAGPTVGDPIADSAPV